ncbi:MAG TPA: di-trans,poly-cis-decaprenylcistransferase, partial [Lachnospiraceae bacterium]|nr:di-trans,poly-cis-decaprenylcistransferase [Lachnospiraceae bacterium]
DGNGRWAKKRFLPRVMGHRAGAQALDKLLKDAEGLGVGYITVYAFSTENWKRTEEEVNGIMGLLREYINRYFNENESMSLRINSMGDLSALNEGLRNDIIRVKELSKERTGITLTIAINYGGRDEIRRATTQIAKDCLSGKISPENINDALISSYLDAPELPDPELIIRTSGEYRTSNFLLWEAAYSEYYFTDKLWPDFTVEDLKEAIAYYQTKDRRFGGRNEDKK